MMYNNKNDNGRNGRNFEVLFRELINGKIEAVHGQGKSDIAVKSGVTIECKTGAGMLTAPIYATKEEATEALESGAFRMTKAKFVAYLPTFDGTNEADAFILTQANFIKVFRDNGKLRVKQASSGGWAITIQNYIPTPTFKASVKTYEKILADLFDNGEFYDIFLERMGL